MSSKRDVSDEQNERHKKILDRLLKADGNKFCVDCGMRSPTWASVNLGVFMCMTCSGIHRSLGVHISQVRSTKLDTWLPKQVEFIQRMGNIKGNKYWEADLPPGYRRPSGVAPNPELQKFIRDKYCDAKFAAKDVPAPNIENYLSHPYVMVDDAAEQEPAKSVTAAKPVVSIPLPPKGVQPASAPAPAASFPAPQVAASPAAPAVDFDLLCMDSAPSSVQTQAVSADDPFGAFTAAPTGAPLSSVNDPFAPVTESVTTVLPAGSAPEVAAPAPAVAVSAPPAKPSPAKPADPFATLVGDDLISNMKQVSIQPTAEQAKAAVTQAPVTKTAADILKLYDTPQANTYVDPFLGPVAPDNQFGSGQFGSAQFGAPPNMPPVNGLYPAGGFQTGAFPLNNAQFFPQYPAAATPQIGNMYGASLGMQQQANIYGQPVYGGAVPYTAGAAGATACNAPFTGLF